MESAIVDLVRREHSASYAMQFTQAALNTAHALSILSTLDRWPKEGSPAN